MDVQNKSDIGVSKVMIRGKEQECRLIKAYKQENTKIWLAEMESFENIIDWWGERGILTDKDYQVYDLEYADKRALTEYKTRYSREWSKGYYENVKSKVEEMEE